MTTNQEKIFNYLLFFLLSLTGLASLLLVKNNYLYAFVFIFLIFYWQKENVRQTLAKHLKSSPSFLTFLALGMIGVLLFQIFSRSPRFYQRPILTLLISLIFYLPYFFLWYKILLKRKNAILKTFFLSGLGGVLIFGILFGKLTTTILTAPNLASGLFYAMLKAAGILTVVGAISSFPLLFFSNEKTSPLASKTEKKGNAGFGLVEVLIGVGIFLLSLTLVGTARHRQEVAWKNLETIKQDRTARTSQPQVSTPTPTETQKVEKGTEVTPRKKSETNAKKDTAARKPPASSGGKDSEFSDVSQCFPGSPDPVCIAIFGEEPSSYYDPYEDPNSPEYQQQLMEQWYYSQPSPEELFFNDPMQLWSQDPGMYEMFENMFDFEPIPGLPSIF